MARPERPADRSDSPGGRSAVRPRDVPGAGRRRVRAHLRRSAALAAAGATLLLAACATAPATGERIFTGGLSLERAQRLGARQHPEMLQRFGGGYDEAALQDYVASVGRLLAETSELPQLDWTFTVLDTPVVNAFALPGGYVYVSRGLIALAENEAQLASVLAHEIGHVTARHSAERYGNAQLAGLASVLSGALLGRTAGQAASALSQVALASYSRSQELEADTLGIRYLARAGYDPEAAAAFLGKLKTQSALDAKLTGGSGGTGPLDLLRTHPRTVERVRQAMARADTAAVAEPMRARDVYLDRLDGLLYGHSPDQGFVRGRRFLHPDLRLAFRVPRGYRLQNGRDSVLARGGDGGVIVFDRADGTVRGELDAYLARSWAKGTRLEGLTRITVNGMPAATALARGRSQGRLRTLRLAAIRYDSETVYRFLFVPPGSGPPERAAQATLRSFRKLGRAEAAQLAPRRLRLYTVEPGDTQAALARRLPFERLALERLRVLNGLDPGQALQPGRRLKLIQ